MQIFELHFNPKQKEEQIFDSFVYEPESVYEKKLGSLYIVGELQNALPSNSKLLDNLAQVVKKNFYTLSLNSSEKALSQASKKANEFLAQQVKKENVSWLGNLNFAVLCLANLNLTFTKTGDIKILLLRQGEIIDMGKNLDLQEIDPYPLKIFFNVVSGKLVEDDIILVLTKKVFEFFKQEKTLFKIAQTKELSSKNIKNVLPSNPKISGICFVAVLKTQAEKAEAIQPILFQNKRKFSLPKFKFPFKFPKIIKKPRLPKLPKIRIPSPGPLVEKFKKQTKIKKKIILIAVLILILVLGFYVFQKTSEKKQEPEISPEEIAALERLNKLERILSPEIITKTGSEELLYSLSGSNSPPSNSLVEPPSFEFNFDLSASYFSNLYFLDKKDCRIIKYPHLWGTTWGSPKIWKEKNDHCSNPKSMSIDGSVWILNSDDSILRYYGGSLQETISLDIFPGIENITQIKTKPNIPYLYLLEPSQNRIIIIDKEGKIIKQFQSEKFNNLKDFEISTTGKTIYLLNNSTIYKLKM